jgi:hypothetical protein
LAVVGGFISNYLLRAGERKRVFRERLEQTYRACAELSEWASAMAVQTAQGQVGQADPKPQDGRRVLNTIQLLIGLYFLEFHAHLVGIITCFESLLRKQAEFVVGHSSVVDPVFEAAKELEGTCVALQEQLSRSMKKYL